MEACEVCGFAWDAVPAAEIPSRLRAAAAGFADVLRSGAPSLGVRRDEATWSPLEYACHTRDVLLNLRERIILGLAEDNPVPKPMFGDLRISVGLYAQDDPARCALEIDAGAGLLARTIEALDPEWLERPIFSGWPREATRTLRWIGAQALHEAEHHLDDVRRLAAS